MNMIAAIRPTSKASLKLQCLAAAKYNVDEAAKLYDFMIKGMEDMPMYDTIPPSPMQQFKDGAVQTLGWINENQDTIMNWIGTIRGMFGKNVNNIPPSVHPSDPIPSINP